MCRAQELCEGPGGGRPGFPVPDKPDGFCGRKATLKRNVYVFSSDACGVWPSTA